MASAAPSVGFFCKSYRGDFVPLKQLIESFQAHNPSGLKLLLSLPHEDIAPFKHLFGSNPPYVDVISDESYAGTDLSRFSGWQAQQICKLMSRHTVNADHYLVLDSDCYFIKDIAAGDLLPVAGKRFLAYASRIRTVLKKGNTELLRYIRGELKPSTEIFPAPPVELVDRLDDYIHLLSVPQSNLDAIARSDIPMKAFGRREWIYCQPGQIFSSGLLRLFTERLEIHKLNISDAILMSPWEYNWYGEFASTFGHCETEFRISPFVHFQCVQDIEFARTAGISERQLMERFAIVQMASGHINQLRYD